MAHTTVNDVAEFMGDSVGFGSMGWAVGKVGAATGLVPKVVKPITTAYTNKVRPNNTIKHNTNEFISLYRAISPDEVAQIKSTGKLENIMGIERKYFATTYDGAKQYAYMAEKGFGDPPYKIIETRIPRSIFETLPCDLKEVVDNGIQVVLIPTESLDILSIPKFLENTLTQKPKEI